MRGRTAFLIKLGITIGIVTYPTIRRLLGERHS